jgi:hypothetical protein
VAKLTKEDQIQSLVDHLSYEEEIYLHEAEKIPFVDTAINTKAIASKVKQIAPDIHIIPPTENNETSHVQVAILSSLPKDQLFWENVCTALTVYGRSAQVIKKETLPQKSMKADLYIGWRSLEKDPSILPMIRKVPSEKKMFIKDTPLWLLPDLFYIKDPIYKATLWKEICRKIPSLPK